MKTAAKRKQGQAMIELIIGLVAVLVLVSGLLQVASLTKNHTDAMVEARGEAGRKAVDLFGGAESGDYIKDWEAGADGKRYTRDDDFTGGSRGAFVGTIVDKAGRSQEDWDIITRTPHKGMAELRSGAEPTETFGLLHGEARRDVVLLPAVRSLLYRADSIDVESEAWMTWCTGIY